MNKIRSISVGIIKVALALLCKIDSRELLKLPKSGPFLIIMNHTNFLEVPILYCYLYPRKIRGIVKNETWKNPILGLLANLWQAIPIKRGINDMNALREIDKVLEAGGIIALSPEGSRSKDGILRRAKPGMVSIALKNKVPIYPIAHFGGEEFWCNIKRFKRTQLTFMLGEPFYLNTAVNNLSHTTRLQLADFAFQKVARLMPEKYWGYYSKTLMNNNGEE